MGLKIANVAVQTDNSGQPIGEGFSPLAFNDNPNHDELGRFTDGGGAGSIREPAKGAARGASAGHRQAQDEEIAKVSAAEKQGPRAFTEALDSAKGRLAKTGFAVTKEKVEGSGVAKAAQREAEEKEAKRQKEIAARTNPKQTPAQKARMGKFRHRDVHKN